MLVQSTFPSLSPPSSSPRNRPQGPARVLTHPVPTPRTPYDLQQTNRFRRRPALSRRTRVRSTLSTDPATDYAMACRLAAMAGSSILPAGGADKAPDRGASRQVLYAALVSPTRVQNGGDGDESDAPPHLNLNVTVFFGAANGDAPRRRRGATRRIGPATR